MQFIIAIRLQLGSRVSERKRLAILLRRCNARKFNSLVEILLNTFFNLIEGDVEKLLSIIHKIHPAGTKGMVQSRLELDCILGEDESMHIKAERNGGISQLVHTILRIKSAGHADLIHIFTKRADIGYDIDVAGASLLLTQFDKAEVFLELLSVFIQFCNPGLNRGRFFCVGRAEPSCQGRKFCSNMLLVLEDLGTALLKFLFQFSLFPFLLADLANTLLLGLLELLIIKGKGELIQLP